MKILVTGAGGFIGSHLVERLLKEDFKVRAFVRYNSQNSWGWLECLEKNEKLEIYRGDIRDYDSVYNSMKNIDIVFHLAALISIPYSYVSPLAYIKTNIEGTYNILQAAREMKVSKVIITSTSEIYGTAQYIPIDEKHPCNPQSPYAATKVAADKLALSYWRSFELPVIVVRPFNTYGPRQSARAVIPTIITQLLSGKREVKLGALHPTRDLVFVKDTVEGFFRLAKTDDAVGEEVNIATGKEISIEELTHKIIKIVKVKANIITDAERLRPEKSEVERLCGSNKKLKELTGWVPEYTLDKGLKETVAWFKNEKVLNKYKADLYNI